MTECKMSTETFETKKEGKTNRILLNGYWIWWCYQHRQPLAWCEKHDLKQQRDDLLEACREGLVSIKEVLNQYMMHDADSSRAKLPVERMMEAAIDKCKA